MKRSLYSIAILTILALNLSAAALMLKADFSGTWTLDKARSNGLPLGMEQTMKVSQTSDTVKIETKVKTDQGEQTVVDSYILDAKENDFTLPNTTDAKGKRTSKWSADGNGFEVSEKAKVDTPEGEATIEASRKWTLAADGKTLTIEMKIKGPQGEQQTKRTFIKQ